MRRKWMLTVPTLIDLLIELVQVHDDTPVEDWPRLLAELGRNHAFVQ
jgi:hypothetical protein